MRIKRSDSRTSTLLPDYIASTITDIDFAYLKKAGIRRCFIDIDGTITHRGDSEVDTQTARHIRQSGLSIYIATNRLSAAGLEKLAQAIGAHGFVHPTDWRGKPSRTYYRRALNVYGFRPEETAMVGDRLLQDVWGAKRAGLATIFVQQRLNAHNSRYEHMVDRWQEWLLRRWTTLYREV